MKECDRITAISSKQLQFEAFAQLYKFFAKVYEEGFSEGFKEGKKKALSINKN